MTIIDKIRYVVKAMIDEFDLEDTPETVQALITAMRDEAIFNGAPKNDPQITAYDVLINTMTV